MSYFIDVININTVRCFDKLMYCCARCILIVTLMSNKVHACDKTKALPDLKICASIF